MWSLWVTNPFHWPPKAFKWLITEIVLLLLSIAAFCGVFVFASSEVVEDGESIGVGPGLILTAVAFLFAVATAIWTATGSNEAVTDNDV